MKPNLVFKFLGRRNKLFPSFLHIRQLSKQLSTTTFKINRSNNIKLDSTSILNHALESNNDDQQSRMSILTEIGDSPGALYDILRYFWKFDINLTHIESRPSPKDSNGFHIYIDFVGYQGDEKTDLLMHELRQRCRNMLVLDEKEVPWFPRHISDLDSIANKTLNAGDDLESDHPGFNDQTYRIRRTYLAETAHSYQYGDKIPHIQYTDSETATWSKVYNHLHELHKKYACQEYLNILALMRKQCDFGPHRIPQCNDISNFLHRRTGFRLRPVAGLLSSRDFLNGLAFRTFFSTQYIRHDAEPLYTPEPDICHELLGHAPMFADVDFADFSQEIGLASLGASDEEIKKLATCYWHSVEFGLVRQGNEIKAYGAGLLSSYGELLHACEYSASASGATTTNISTDKAKKSDFKIWDPTVASTTSYPITTYQPTYFVAANLNDAKQRMRVYCENLPRKFYARYNPLTCSIWVDRAIRSQEA